MVVRATKGSVFQPLERLLTDVREAVHRRDPETRIRQCDFAPIDAEAIPQDGRALLARSGLSRLDGELCGLLAEHAVAGVSPVFVRDGQPWVRARADLLNELVTWQNPCTPEFLERGLRRMGFASPEVRVARTFRASTREALSMVELPAAQLLALLDARAIGPRARRLGALSGDAVVRVGADGNTTSVTLSGAALASIRGVARRLAEDGVQGTATPEQIHRACERRLAERGAVGEKLSLGADGQLTMSPEAARTLLAPIHRLSREAQVVARALPFDPLAPRATLENQAFLAQLSLLSYGLGPGGAPMSGEETCSIVRAMGLCSPKLISVDGAEAIVGLRLMEPASASGHRACVVVAARGTTDAADWATNLRLFPQRVDLDETRSGRVHQGFYTQWTRLEAELDAYVAAVTKEHGLAAGEVVSALTGHSLGGATAIAGAVEHLQKSNAKADEMTFRALPLRQLFTSAPPRRSTRAWGTSFASASRRRGRSIGRSSTTRTSYPASAGRVFGRSIPRHSAASTRMVSCSRARILRGLAARTRSRSASTTTTWPTIWG